MKTETEIHRVLKICMEGKHELLYDMQENVTISPGEENLDYGKRLKTLNTHIGILRWVLEN